MLKKDSCGYSAEGTNIGTKRLEAMRLIRREKKVRILNGAVIEDRRIKELEERNWRQKQ